MTHLFTYGTLGPGQSHEYLLRKAPGNWQTGFIRGILYPTGVGQSLGYPAVCLGSQAEEICGHVYSSDHLSGLWESLDAYEGEGYRRVTTEICLENNSKIQAFIYIANL